MADRIEKVEINKETGVNDLFLDGPGEFLCKRLAEQLLLIPQFKAIFGEFISGYKRMDWAMRNPPVMRIFNDSWLKEFDSWFINGDLTLDVIFPASLRRDELQQFQDTLSSAIAQQFRRPSFFNTMESVTPGLNELGKRVEVDKTLGYEWGEAIVPLTQIKVNFRLDLRIWDLYLVSDNRTKDSPFERVLGDLKRIVGSTEGKNDESETEVTVGTDQKV